MKEDEMGRGTYFMGFENGKAGSPERRRLRDQG